MTWEEEQLYRRLAEALDRAQLDEAFTDMLQHHRALRGEAVAAAKHYGSRRPQIDGDHVLEEAARRALDVLESLARPPFREGGFRRWFRAYVVHVARKMSARGWPGVST